MGIEGIPVSAEDPISTALKETLQPITRPYTRFTGQWQTWNLFAPDPLTQVSSLHIDVLQEGQWQEKRIFSSDTLPWWRSTNMLKIIRYLAQEEEKHTESRMLFFEGLCREEKILPGAKMRARVASFNSLDPSDRSEKEYVFVCFSS